MWKRDLSVVLDAEALWRIRDGKREVSSIPRPEGVK